jgi:uncharacterized membrane protein
VNRAWLFAYPRAYRRERGDEILATIVESGRSGPRVAANLVRHGLRARLGRPASRGVVVWSIVFAAICGLFAASLASWVAWSNGRPHPDEAEVHSVLGEVWPEHDFDDVFVARAVFAFYSQPLTWENLSGVLSFDGGEYELASSGASILGAPPTGGDEAAPTALERLRASGWRVYPPDVAQAVTCHTKTCETPIATTYTSVTAERGDLVLGLWLNSAAGPEETFISVSLQRKAPASVWPAGLTAGLISAVLAWLVFAWASRRSGGGHSVGVGVTVCFALTMVCWWGPALLAIPSMITHQLGEPHPQWHPLWEWLGQPTFSQVCVVGAACALLGVALSLIPARAGRTTHRARSA